MYAIRVKIENGEYRYKFCTSDDIFTDEMGYLKKIYGEDNINWCNMTIEEAKNQGILGKDVL